MYVRKGCHKHCRRSAKSCHDDCCLLELFFVEVDASHTLLRDNGHTLMESFLETQYFTCTDLYRLNLCHIYLKSRILIGNLQSGRRQQFTWSLARPTTTRIVQWPPMAKTSVSVRKILDPMERGTEAGISKPWSTQGQHHNAHHSSTERTPWTLDWRTTQVPTIMEFLRIYWRQDYLSCRSYGSISGVGPPRGRWWGSKIDISFHFILWWSMVLRVFCVQKNWDRSFRFLWSVFVLCNLTHRTN